MPDARRCEASATIEMSGTNSRGLFKNANAWWWKEAVLIVESAGLGTRTQRQQGRRRMPNRGIALAIGRGDTRCASYCGAIYHAHCAARWANGSESRSLVLAVVVVWRR